LDTNLLRSRQRSSKHLESVSNKLVYAVLLEGVLPWVPRGKKIVM
jgi:hypothetical protein